MDYTLLLSPIVAIITAIIGYKTGRRNRENDATRTAFESYKFALESLRNEFERQIDSLRKENQELKDRIAVLESEKEQKENKTIERT